MLGALQRVGKSLMLPIAVLPAAGILLRLGAIDYHNAFVNDYIAKVLLSAGDAIYSNLPLLFAIGVAIGLTEGAGAAGLAGVVGYEILIKVLAIRNTESMTLDTGVLGGIIAGLIAAWMYKKYHTIQLPTWLQFFGGKRFVPIVTALFMVFVGLIFWVIWPPVQTVISDAGDWIVGAGSVGAFVYGTLNRLLIPFGLHHIINAIAWFQVGDFTNAAGEVVHGDLTRFWAGDKTAGMFMTGFFPIMMFALPAACLAMLHEAKKEQKRIAAGILISAALTAFLTGVTEPIEFLFMFLAPALYLVHALLTGVSLALTWALGVKLGFNFSAGAIDYFIFNPGVATNMWLMIPIGLVYAIVYYLLFRAIIRMFNLKTPGREDLAPESDASMSAQAGPGKLADKAGSILKAIGGTENVTHIDACITRLRLTLKDEQAIQEAELKRLGAAGIMKLGQGNVQIVFGPESELLRDEMQKLM
ncbi:MAG TPA: N-acetylglucosamine-specific PTS transporter subunit IIBC [Bacilli bacterium]